MNVREVLTDEIGLVPLEADVFLYVTENGMCGPSALAAGLNAPQEEVLAACRRLVELGGLIDMDGKFEAMHPRFTAVNMYRRMCERRNAAFGRNTAVDNVGAALEGLYDAARTGLKSRNQFAI